MKKLIWIAALPLLAACGDTATETAPTTAKATAEKVETDARAPFDFTELPAGTYTDEDGHAYIQFSYDHQGFSKPILRWSEFDATVDYNPDNPSASKLTVVIPVASIDSMVPVFDDHLRGPDFFDAETYPEIRFESTSMTVNPDGSGTITGDLTVRDITKSITFDGQLNKIGKHFRSGKDMFGISGTGSLLRSDYGVGRYAPNVGDEVELVMEVEFQKD